MKQYFLIRFIRKSGKIDKSMSGLSSAMLQLWALQNTTKTKDTLIFDEDGIVDFYCEGTGDFPKVCEDMKGKHIDEFCDGLLDAVKKEME